MQIVNPTVDAGIWLDPKNCQDVRRWVCLTCGPVRMTMTREEAELKQLRYQTQRARRRKEIGIVDTE